MFLQVLPIIATKTLKHQIRTKKIRGISCFGSLVAGKRQFNIWKNSKPGAAAKNAQNAHPLFRRSTSGSHSSGS
ncbi:MAG: hypothetical protein KDD10_30030, partial [Phaeodactylibacter sp.]|nr:hypothetical protein [Phaeodactylibacter sp.]